jgi:hypothetical protein
VSAPTLRRWFLLPLVLVPLLLAACVDLTEPPGLEDGDDALAPPVLDAAVTEVSPAEAGAPHDDGGPGGAGDAPRGPDASGGVDGGPPADAPPPIDGPSPADGADTTDTAAPADSGSPPADTAAPADSAAPADAAGGVLVVDDFDDGDVTTNNLGGAVTGENETHTLVAGEQKVVWTGTGTQALDEGLRPNRCELDISAFRTVRVRLRSAVAGKRLAVLLGLGDGTCKPSGAIRQTTLTMSATMTSYDIDLSRTARDRTLFIQLAPTSADTTDYFVDDIVLVP